MVRGFQTRPRFKNFYASNAMYSIVVRLHETYMLKFNFLYTHLYKKKGRKFQLIIQHNPYSRKERILKSLSMLVYMAGWTHLTSGLSPG